MRHLRAFLRRVLNVFGRTAQPDAELESELESHVHMLMDEHVRAGMEPDEARRQALLTLGGLESIKETYRDRRGLPILDTTLQDVRYALRGLYRSRGAAGVGIMVMALAIGANTAVFSVVYAVLLNPLPYPKQERIVTLTYEVTSGGETERSTQVSVPDVLDWQQQSRSFAALAYYATRRSSVVAGRAADYTVVAHVTPAFFDVFTAELSAGRLVTSDESREGDSGAVIVSDRYARQHFGGERQAIGQTIRLLDQSMPIVGVWPAAHAFPADADIWFPQDVLGGRLRQHRRANNYLAIARLKDGVSLERTQVEMTTISERLAREYPDTNRNVHVVVTPLHEQLVGGVAPLLQMLLGAVVLVLLVACATMATLLLAQGTARAQEIAVRTALGASRVRIVRQLLVEALVQGMAAGVIGVVIAIWATRALVAVSPPNVPRLDDVAVNGPVLLFTIGLCLLVSVVFGLPPALQAARRDIHARLRTGIGRVAGIGSVRLREWLVVAEIGLAVVLAVTCVLLVKRLIVLQQTPLGFRTANVVLMQATAGASMDDWRGSRQFFKGLLDDVREMPGVDAAGAMMGPPGRVESDSGYWIDRMPEQSPLTSARPAVMDVISPGAFAALNIPLYEGRDFTEGDTADAQRVVIVNQALADAAFQGRPALGRVLIAGFDSLDPMRIVGVVGNARQYGPGREPQPEVYMPYQQHDYNGATLHVIVRSTRDPDTLGAALTRKARERSPEASVRVLTMDEVLGGYLAPPRFRAWLLSLFAIVAVCLAMAGVYGVMAYIVGLRAREIGVRMALGASGRGVLWMMLTRGVWLSAKGLTVGGVGALAAARAIRVLLADVGPNDPAAYVGVIVSFAVLSLLAVYVPARRATRIDPMLVLRQE